MEGEAFVFSKAEIKGEGRTGPTPSPFVTRAISALLVVAAAGTTAAATVERKRGEAAKDTLT